MMKNTNQKHLTLEDRNYSENFYQKTLLLFQKKLRNIGQEKSKTLSIIFVLMSVQNDFIVLRKTFVEETVISFATNVFAVIPIARILKNRYVLL